jgi:hypothetical protein
MNKEGETVECPCTCHPSGSTCSTCESTSCKMKDGMSGALNPIEIGVMMWQKACLRQYGIDVREIKEENGTKMGCSNR